MYSIYNTMARYFSEDMKKYIVIHGFTDNKVTDQQINEIEPEFKSNTESDSMPWSLLSPQKLDKCQEYFDNKSKEWWEGDSLLWNFTLNPDLSKLKPDQRNNISVKRYLWSTIKKIISHKLISYLIEECIIFWEWGTKNNKFHCNICMKIDPKEDPRTSNYLIDKFSQIDRRAREGFKDQRKLFKREDIYNMKDAGYMARMGHPPKHLINKSRQAFLAIKGHIHPDLVTACTSKNI